MKSSHILLKLPYLVLLGIILIALGLRIWGISFGLPYRYHPDEPQHVVEAAKMLAGKTLEPPVFNNPPFYKYVLMVGQTGFIGANLILGNYKSLTDLADHLKTDPSPLYLLGRITSAVAGTLTVWVTYLLGKAAYNVRVGLLGAAFLAVAFLPVRDSHYAVNDALLGLLVTISILGSLLVAQHGRRRDYLLGAIAVGLAFATKYTAIFTMFPLTLAHFFSPGVRFNRPVQLKFKQLMGAWAVVGLAAVVGSPYFVLKPGKVFNDISRSIYSYGAYGFEGWQIDPAGGYLFYLKSLWWGLGPGLVILSALGILFALVKHHKEDIILLSFPLLLYLFMGRQEMYFARFLLPAIPILLVLAARLVDSMVDYLEYKLKLNILTLPIIRLLFLLGVIILVTAEPALASIRHNQLLTEKDTRTLAKEWIEANIPEGAKIAEEWPHHSVPLSTLTDPEPASTRSYEVLITGGHGLPDHSLEYYQQQGFQYLVTSSNIFNIQLADKQRNEMRQKFYASLDKHLKLIYEVQPYEGNKEPPFIFDEIYGPVINLWQRERPGPTIKIYSVN